MQHGHEGVRPGPASPRKRSKQRRAKIVHGTCRGRMPPTVPARTLLCGGADVLACKIRFSPEIEATRNGWCAWAPGRAALAVHYAVRQEGAGSCAWGVMPSPLHAVRMKRFGHLVPFRTKSLPRPTSKARQQQRPQPSRTPPTQGVYVACVPASVRHACSFPCRLLQRGLHDAVCLLVSCLLVLVFVLHACSCLSRTLPREQGG